MRRLDGIPPVWPSGLVLLRRIDPFREQGRGRDRRARGLGHHLLRNPCSQRINRLKLWDLTGVFHGHHMVWMHHLPDAIKQLDPSRHQSHRAFWQLFLKIISTRVKKHELKGRLGVLHRHPVSAIAVPGGAMSADFHFDRYNPGQIRALDRLATTAIHQRIGQ